MNGRLNGRPVIDFHARLIPRPTAVDRLLATMDDCGIDRAVVSAGGVIDLDLLSKQVTEGGHVETDADNDAVLRGCERSDGRLVPFYFANPHADPDDYRRRAGEFRGVELAPAVHGVALNDERTAALVDVAGEFGHPVYLLCMIKPGFNVRDLVELARRFTGVTFVLGHCGFTNLDLYAINAIAPESNIVTDTSGGYTIVVGAALERLGADRVLFGTEYPLQHPSVELAKLRALDVPPETWRKVAWSNAHRLLGEEPPPNGDGARPAEHEEANGDGIRAARPGPGPGSGSRPGSGSGSGPGPGSHPPGMG